MGTANIREAVVRKVKVKRLRVAYSAWLKGILPHVPKGRKPISFRVWRRLVHAV